MSRITHWLKPDTTYIAKHRGVIVTKSNLGFLTEVITQINKQIGLKAEIRYNMQGEGSVDVTRTPRLV